MQPGAAGEGIPLEALHAGADRAMVLRDAEGVDPARADAGVPALVRDAGQVRGAVLVDDALGSTVRWGPQHAAKAGAHGPRVHHTTLRVRPARRWYAWIHRFRGWN